MNNSAEISLLIDIYQNNIKGYVRLGRRDTQRNPYLSMANCSKNILINYPTSDTTTQW